MIPSKDISVIIQGPISFEKPMNSALGLTDLLILAIKKHLPDATIILSTWSSYKTEFASQSKASHLCDSIIYSLEPTSLQFNSKSDKKDNCNKMLLSTLTGLKAAKTKFSLKVRSDLHFINPGFLEYCDKFNKRAAEYIIFKNRIISYPYYSRRGLTNQNGDLVPTPFHISDWCCFGLTEDLINLFDIPIITPETHSRYFFDSPPAPQLADPDANAKWQYPPEQYLLYQCVKKHFPDIELKHKLDYNPTNIAFSDKIVANNFIFAINGVFIPGKHNT
jgi:hypothetical protein